MTAATAQPGLGAERPSTDAEIIHRLTLLLARSFTKHGHLAMRNPREGLGECSYRRCGPSCIEATALLEAAIGRLEEMLDERPAQLTLLGEAR